MFARCAPRKGLFKRITDSHFIFNPYIVIDDQGYDGNHINGIIDLTDEGIGVCYNGPYGLSG